MTKNSPKRILICVTDGLASELLSKNGWGNIKDSDENAKVVFLHTTSTQNVGRNAVEQKGLQDYMRVVTKGLYFPIEQDVLINGSTDDKRAASKGNGVCSIINDMLLRCVEGCQPPKGAIVARREQPNVFFQLNPEVFNSSQSNDITGRDGPLFPLNEVVDIDIINALNSGSGMRPENMYKVSVPTLFGVEEDDTDDIIQQVLFSEKADCAIRDSEVFIRNIATLPLTGDAQRIWGEASIKVRSSTADLVSAFEDCVFPFNRFTRRKADFKGPQLHLQGLIKAVITDFNYKKFYSTRSAGGKREYAVCLLLDISQSMDGHLLSSALESLIMMVEALMELKLDEFSLVLFGSNVHLIKDGSQVWGKEHILSLLAPKRLHCTGHTTTNDGAAVKLGTHLLQKYASKSRKMFVLSDGFTSNGKEAMSSIRKARDVGIDVIGIGVGMCKTNVQDLYSNWITAALPRALPAAFRELYSPDRESVPPAVVGPNKEVDTWRKASLLSSTTTSSSESVASILQSSLDAFDKLQSLLKDARELSLVRGNSPGAIIVDLVFLVDCTGSMKPMLTTIKSDILSIAVGGGTKETLSIIERVKEQFPGNKIQMRCALVEFRDTGCNDAVPLKAHKGKDLLLDATGKPVPAGEGNFFNLTFDLDTSCEEVPGQRAAFTAAVNSLQAHGGGDLAEDLPQPLLQVGDWPDWKGQARFALLFTDAPPHGSDFHTSEFNAKGRTGDSAADKSTQTAANFEKAFQTLIAKNVKTFICTCNKNFTDVAMAKLKSIVAKKADEVEKTKAASEGRKDHGRTPQELVDDYLKEICIFETPAGVQTPGMHVIFVLDESGSMDGPPWNSLMAAYRDFLKKRMGDQGGEGDMVSIVLFSSSARVIGPVIQPIEAAPSKLSFAGGGTSFYPAMIEAEKCLAATPTNKSPVVLFMSDGDSGDYCQAAAVSTRMFATCDSKKLSLQIHTIAFGSGADKGPLKTIATLRGTFHDAPTGVDLQETFKTIAAGAGPSEAIFKEVGSRIADAVTDKLTIEYF